MSLRLAISAFLSFCFLASCGVPVGQREYRFKNFAVFERANALPAEIPDFFRYPEAKIEYSAVFDSGRFNVQPEGAAVYSTGDSNEEVRDFYLKNIASNGWKIIQSVNNPGESLLMAESPFSKIVTIIIRGTAPSQVRIFFKGSGSD